ncbi:MAG: oligosaccharide flippase family protein [Actinobacteria bacterium]|uniref:Unannotated protein n=1 Tax=freshwater metagenome TaxID=449393 RepID=A0A6J6QJD7_9ZZZZ|nr:oligosaccharide flippase family protein [Actinomycetota bacterium]
MPSRVLWRRSATAFSVYGSTALGFLATIVAARELSTGDFARFALVFGATTLLQLFVDLTIDEVVVKYGNRYAATQDWGRFHRLIRIGFLIKMIGGAAGTLAVIAAAALSPWLWQTGGIVGALLIASLIPLIQQPEGMAGALLLLRSRYDLRGAMLFWAMALRFVAIVIAAPHGLLPVFVGIVVAQAISTVSVVAVGWVAFRRFPRAPAKQLGDDRPAIRSFAIQSSLASGLTSLRTSLPTVLVGVVAAGAQVGNFRIAQAPQTAFQSLSAPARLVLLAEQTRDIEHGRPDRAFSLLRRYIVGTTLFSLVVTPPLWIFMPGILRFVYSGKWAAAANPCRVMVLVACVQLIFAWTKTFPVSIGRPGLRLAGQAVEIAVLVPALLALTVVWGATGAAIGALISSLALAGFWIVWIGRIRRGTLSRSEAVA